MARFRGTVVGYRGEASRLGHEKSGLRVKCNGWEVGITAEASVRDGKDVIDVWLTSGSGGASCARLLGTAYVRSLDSKPDFAVENVRAKS